MRAVGEIPTATNIARRGFDSSSPESRSVYDVSRATCLQREIDVVMETGLHVQSCFNYAP